MIILKSRREIERMRQAGRLVARVLAELGRRVRPGVTTAELASFAEEFIVRHGGYPTFKGYRGFPAPICVAPNDVVIHGIPGPERLREGDILGIDVGVTLDGYVGDRAHTFPVGEVGELGRRLLEAAEASLAAGIAKALPGGRVGDIGAAVERVAREAGFSVVREYVGHGVGRAMHEEPSVPNFGPPGRGPLLKEGMVIAIEPMVNAGAPETVTDPDGWTVRTKDGSLSAHFEHTVAITADGPEILTLDEAV
ncbi:MAG: type I methionyl aminopeptidase [Clostridia bacterium]|nr:type I methionyl aminopeptidase [Clostridia bacterium]